MPKCLLKFLKKVQFNTAKRGLNHPIASRVEKNQVAKSTTPIRIEIHSLDNVLNRKSLTKMFS